MRRTAIIAVLFSGLVLWGCEREKQVQEETTGMQNQQQPAQQETAQQPAQQETAAADGQQFYGQSPAYSGQIPETVTLEAKNGNITFNHKAHGERAECQTCHAEGTPQKIELDQAMGHKLCRGCHEEQGAGPTKCAECHKKE